MRRPSMSPRKLLSDTVVVVVLFGALQYFGIFYEEAGTVDWVGLAILAVLFPVIRYGLELVSANVRPYLSESS